MGQLVKAVSGHKPFNWLLVTWALGGSPPKGNISDLNPTVHVCERHICFTHGNGQTGSYGVCFSLTIFSAQHI